MSKPKHTPGPWKTSRAEFDGRVFGVWSESTGDSIATRITTQDPVQCEANANLIAAAPELLKFLKVLSDRMSHDPDPEYQTILDGALAVIANAEGRAK